MTQRGSTIALPKFSQELRQLLGICRFYAQEAEPEDPLVVSANFSLAA
jgi:hypothetical protein